MREKKENKKGLAFSNGGWELTKIKNVWPLSIQENGNFF